MFLWVKFYPTICINGYIEPMITFNLPHGQTFISLNISIMQFVKIIGLSEIFVQQKNLAIQYVTVRNPSVQYTYVP